MASLFEIPIPDTDHGPAVVPRINWEERYNRDKKQKRTRRNKAKKAKRDAKRKIERELRALTASLMAEDGRNLRQAALEKAVERPRGDKLLEQLRTRTAELATVWQAMKIAGDKYGPECSDAKIAKVYQGLTGDLSFNRHKARSRRPIVRSLEQAGMPWHQDLLPRSLA